jgi:regulator of protease activity HflC (stomatin/prohibitin superfamily)
MSKAKIGGAIAALVVVILVIGAIMSITVVETGHAGVVYNRNGGIEKQALPTGWHFINPLQRVTEYPIKTTTVEFKDVKVGTSDGKPIVTNFSFNYNIDQEKLPSVFSKFGGQSAGALEDGFLRQRLTEVAKSVTTKYSVLEVLGEKSQEISLAILKGFAEDVKQIGFVVESVTFTPPAPDENTAKAIQAKVDAQQKLEQQKTELEQAKIVAEQKRVEAQGNADKALIEAQGQAKANDVLKQSLTPELVQMEIAKKWNGTLPTVTGGSTPMIQLPSTTK